MRHYETLFIIHPDLTEEESVAVAEEFAAILTDHDAVMVKVDHWGRRTLAYVVKKQKKGYYVLFEYGSEAEGVAEMERRFKIDERIIRYLTVKLDDEFDAERALEAASAPKPEEAEREDGDIDESDDDDDQNKDE